MRGSLHYFFDAVMPFLQIFCRSYYQPDKDQFSDEQEKLSRLTLTFEKYEEYYKEEEEVNVTLNIFAENMQRTYCGVNKVQTQIGCTILPNKEYSKVGGDEELPLGQEFQDHLRCFIDTDAKDPQTKYAPAKILVEQMRLQDLSEEEKIEQLELDVRCLQLMRGLIHNEIIRLPDDQDLNTDGRREGECLTV
nr:hypothetical protein BaRGS_016341 [Batillaria attramentaria]